MRPHLAATPPSTTLPLMPVSLPFPKLGPCLSCSPPNTCLLIVLGYVPLHLTGALENQFVELLRGLEPPPPPTEAPAAPPAARGPGAALRGAAAAAAQDAALGSSTPRPDQEGAPGLGAVASQLEGLLNAAGDPRATPGAAAIATPEAAAATSLQGSAVAEAAAAPSPATATPAPTTDAGAPPPPPPGDAAAAPSPPASATPVGADLASALQAALLSSLLVSKRRVGGGFHGEVSIADSRSHPYTHDVHVMYI